MSTERNTGSYLFMYIIGTSTLGHKDIKIMLHIKVLHYTKCWIK